MLENEKTQIEKKLKLLNEGIYVNRHGIETTNEPIISDGLQVISKNKNAIKFNNKSEFESVLSKQKYFSASQSHCYYSTEDYLASQKGDEKFMNKNVGTSEADNGCVMIFETGHELVALWSEKDKVGYIIPSDKIS